MIPLKLAPPRKYFKKMISSKSGIRDQAQIKLSLSCQFKNFSQKSQEIPKLAQKTEFLL
jgi:hypothetical protein